MNKDANNKNEIMYQIAMIWNYNVNVEHQYNYFTCCQETCGSDETNRDIFESYDDYGKHTNQDSPVDAKTPVESFVDQVKRIMLLAEKKNGQEMVLTARGNGGTYIYKVDGQGFCEVMDKLVNDHTLQIEEYLNGANAEAAGSIKYVCPFIGFVLDTHLYSEPKLQKSDLKSVMEEVYGKGTSATSKLSTKNDADEAQILFGIVEEIMKNARKA